MDKYQRIVREGSTVKITTVENEEFIGILLPMYYIISENNTILTEIYLSQSKEHQGDDYGTIGFPTSYIKSIESL